MFQTFLTHEIFAVVCVAFGYWLGYQGPSTILAEIKTGIADIKNLISPAPTVILPTPVATPAPTA